MKNKGLWIGVGVAAALVLFVGGSYISGHNTGVGHETGISAQWDKNRNEYSAFTQTAVEQMGVATRYQEGLSKILTDGLSGRYGEDGVSGTLVAIQEQYPGVFDSTMYANIQRTLEAGRTNFKREQNMLIGKVEAYERDLRMFWSGFWLKTAGYPTLDLAEFGPIVNEATNTSYSTGVDQGIKF